MITAINNVSYKNNYYMSFEGKKKQAPQHEPRHSSSALKAIPLATLIAMSPLNAPSATYEVDQNPEKTILFQTFKDNSTNTNYSVNFVDTDGNENTAERIDVSTTSFIQRNVPDRVTREKIPVKYASIHKVSVDTLKQVNVTTKYESSGNSVNSTEYFVVGSGSNMTTAQIATDGSNKRVRPPSETKTAHRSLQIPKQIYDYLIEVTSDGLPRKTETRRDFISIDEESESWGL